MKPSLFHGIYISLIALSTFFYFTKRNRTDALYERIGDSLTNSSNALSKMSEGAYKRIEIDVEIEPKYEKYLDLAKFIKGTTQNFVAEFDKPTYQSQINKDSFVRFQNRIYEQIAKNSGTYDTSELKKRSTINYCLQQNSFWDKTLKISNAGLAAKVKTIKNNAIIDQAMLLNYCLDKTSNGCCFCMNFPKVSILPRKITVVEDDSLLADILYGVRMNRNQEKDVFANGKLVKVNSGISLIKIKNLKIGEHKIDLSTTVRNYSNGKFDTIRDIFYYEVLPKCGKNCRSNQ